MRAVNYARYSTDLQKPTSIEDQLFQGTQYIEKEGWTHIDDYTDPEVSASHLLRPGIQSLIDDAMKDKFDVVVVEDLDRVSRDQEDTAGLYKRLQFAGVRIYSLEDGYITELHVGLKSTVNAVQLKQTAQKVRRGQAGRVRAGKSPGGNSYGYVVDRKFGPDGEPIRGDRKVNKDEARIVVRVYEEYVAGHSPRAICGRLNNEGIESPSGKGWSQSTLNGNRRRGNGLLNNELYVGRYVYNRQRFIRHPDTGKRVARLNPEDEWVRQAVPHLRIISDELWQAVKDRQKKLDAKKPSLWKMQRPRNLLSYLLKCGECGSGFSMVSGTHCGCSSARNKGTCDNRMTMHREKLEQKVLGALRGHLMDPALCEEFCNEYVKQLNRVRMTHNASLNSYRTEFERLERERSKLVQSILDGVPGSVLKDDATRIEKRKRELESLLANTKEAPPLFHPNMAKRYHEEVQRLIESLNEEDHRAEAAELIRSLVEKVVLTPTADRTALVVDLHGDLAGILTMATGEARREVEKHVDVAISETKEAFENQDDAHLSSISQDMLVAGVDNQRDLISKTSSNKKDMLVAGAGFEPATFRL